MNKEAILGEAIRTEGTRIPQINNNSLGERDKGKEVQKSLLGNGI